MDERSLKRLNLAFRFALELLALLALFLFGWTRTDSLPIQLVLALAMPAAAMVAWGLFVAPRASRRLDDPARLAVESVVWFAGVLAYGFAVSWILAILFGLAVIISVGLMFYWGQRAH